jgi:ATP-binding cassette subfamily B protein
VDESRALLHKLPLLQFVAPEARQLVVDSFTSVSYGFGSPIVREGDRADAFYVLVSGKARVVKKGLNGEEIPLGSLRAGDSFGEMALLGHTTRTATVRASSDVHLFKLDTSVFKALVESQPRIKECLELQIKHRSLHNFFRMHSPFTQLPAEALRIFLDGLVRVTIQTGDLLIREGDPPGAMYIVEEGRLRVFREESGRRQYLNYLRKGDFVGEMSLFKQAPRAASVEAVSECHLLKLTPDTFRRLLSEYPDFKTQIEQRIAQYDYKHVARVPLDFSEEMLPAAVRVHQQVSPDQAEEIEAPAEPTTAGPFASPEGFFVKKPGRRWRFPHVFQVDEMDCGAASLAMVCRHFGRSVSLARIRQLVHTSLDGTSLRALCTAAGELGLAARAVKATPESLPQMPLPAIVHWKGNHWVVLYDLDKTHVRIADPGLGLRRIPRAEFDQKWTGYAALYDYTHDFKKAPESAPTLGWLTPFFKPFAALLIKALALALIVSGLQMVLPVFTQVVVDKVLVEHDVDLLQMLIIAMLGVLVFMSLAMVLQRYLLSFVAVRLDAASLDFLTRKMLALPLTYFQSRRTGDIQRRMAGTRQVRELMVQNGVRALTSLAQIVAAIVLMFVYSVSLTFVFLITVPLYAGLMFFSRRWLRPLFQDLEESFGKYHSYQIDAIKGIETVKALGAEGGFREMMLREFMGIAHKEFRADFTIMCYQGAVQMVTFLSMILFLAVGARLVMDGEITIGALVAFNALVALANGAIGTLLPLWDSVQLASVLLNRLNDIFEQEQEQGPDHGRLMPVRTLEGRIRFQGMSFQYGGPEAPRILDNITFDVPAGKMVAIVGRSGSGKTTLIKCLSGLLEPTEGTIYYDGIDLKTLNYRDLRRHIGFVLQENYLFNDTIARNIAFGEDEPDMDRVLWAARVANAHEFIDRLPLGYETKVGESGLAISGGQRQRIAIARALYHQPPVLIFDEATSALDTESERAIKDNMEKLLEGRTSFVIAHRLSTIRGADLIMVLERGKLVEHGRHEELMERQGLYYYLCSQQLGM